MANALDWLRNKAELKDTDVFTLETGETVQAQFYHFKGVLPSRMIFELNGLVNDVVKDDFTNETLRIGGERRGDFNNCEFSRTLYIIQR